MAASRLCALALLAWFLAARPATAATDITQCGELVASGHQGILLNALVCPSATGRCLALPNPACTTDGDCPLGPCIHAAIFMQGGASLDLGGFSVSGAVGDEPSYGIYCNGPCKVSGGEIRNVGLGLHTVVRARLTDLDIHDASAGGIGDAGGDRLFLEGVTVTQVGATGPLGGAVIGTRIRVIDSVTVSNNMGVGIRTFRSLTGSNLTVNGNGDHGIVSVGPVRLTGLTANGNAGAGLVTDPTHVRLVGSTLTGNNGGGAGIDIVTPRFPRLIDTTCGKSADSLLPTIGPSWGVCAGD